MTLPHRAMGLGLLLGLAGAASMPVGADVAATEALSVRFDALATLEVPVEEISGMAPLPGGNAVERSFLVVTDEGGYDAEKKTVDGALYVVSFRYDTASAVKAAAPRPVTLRLELERFDPAWPARVSPLDLESIVRLPDSKDLYLLGGERNPEDHTDDGANRLYVVRYPDGTPDAARVLAYYRLFDLPDDLMNDRFEGVAARAAKHDVEGERAWTIYAFKERTAFPERAPAYVRGRLTGRKDGSFDLRVHGDRGHGPLLPDFLTQDHERLASQADACVAADGAVWVLDRWRRELHRGLVRAEDDRLVLDRSFDYFPFVKDIPGEVSPLEPAPAGRPERRGYGRHEAITFDEEGRLYLASDRGGGRTSTVTVLVPK